MRSFIFRILFIQGCMATFLATSGTAQIIYQAVPGDICVGQTVQYVYQGGCSSSNITWFLDGDNDATLTVPGENMVNVTWHSASANTSVVAYCTPEPTLSAATPFLTVHPSGGTVSVSITGPVSLCQGVSATYQASIVNGGSSPHYQWRVNGSVKQTGSASSFSPNYLTIGDEVTVSVLSNKPCVSSASATSNTITINEVAQLAISPEGPLMICSTCEQVITASTGTGYTYQWNKNGVPISGATTSSYTATADGEYTVTINVPNNCNVTSNVLALSLNKLPVVNAGTDQTFHIPPNTKVLNGEAYDLDGTIESVLWTKESGPMVTLVNASTLDLILENVQEGTYTFKLTATDNMQESSSAMITITVVDLSNNYNWIKETTIFQENTQTLAEVSGLQIANGDKAINWSYFDGLGRPKQSVSVQGSPDTYDIVQPVVYDNRGREAEKYLPYVSGQQNGWYNVDPVGKETVNYNASPQRQFYFSDVKIAQDDKPYAITEFEPSPLNRVLKQGAPGATWQPHVDPLQDRSVKMAYQFNNNTDVIKLKYDPQTEQLSVNSSNVYYPPYQLFANKTMDEHNNEVIEYVDKMGRTLCKKVQYKTEGTTKSYAETYYVYDDFGNLVLVLQPEGVEQLKNTLPQQP